MTRIIKGVFAFQKNVFASKEELFRQLGEGQHPLALFITCSDSRISPNMLTQTQPGELFILRNAGNIVPPAGSPVGGEAATIEYAVVQLKIRDIILCGHAKCGAMQGLLTPPSAKDLPLVLGWLNHAKDSVRAAKARGKELPPETLLSCLIERNVLLQLDHIRTYEFIREALTAGRLRLHGWVYDFESGQVTAYDAAKDAFVPLELSTRPKWLAPALPGDSSIDPRDIQI